MKKTFTVSTFLAVLFAITTVIFGTLYFTEKSNKGLEAPFLSTGPLTRERANHYLAYFHNTLDQDYNDATKPKGIFPYGVWVDKKIVKGPLNADSVDGFRIIPIRYDEPVVRGQDRFSINDVNFAIFFTYPDSTKTHHLEYDNLGFDYNQPCPHIPCP